MTQPAKPWERNPTPRDEGIDCRSCIYFDLRLDGVVGAESSAECHSSANIAA